MATLLHSYGSHYSLHNILCFCALAYTAVLILLLKSTRWAKNNVLLVIAFFVVGCITFAIFVGLLAYHFR